MSAQNVKNTKSVKKPAKPSTSPVLDVELSLELSNLLGMGPGSEWERQCLNSRR